MKLLEAEPVVAPEVAPEPTRETPQEQPPGQPEAARTCSACGAPMEADQDWCLTCGTAAPGRLGQRPGWRAASTVMALTLLLVLGAIGASYAALTGDDKPAAAPAPGPAQPQAQVAPPAPTQTQPTEPAPQGETPSTTDEQSNDLPKVKTNESESSSGAPITPTPSTSTPAPTPTPTPSDTGTSTRTGTTPSTTTDDQGSQAPVDPGPQAIELAGDAGTAYDPYKRAKAAGDPERALDGDDATSWYVDPSDPAQLGVGYAVNLGKLQGIREIQLQTPTPGFRIEVYATDETELPPDILDTRWSHITNVSNVGAKDDGKQKIVLGAGTTKYRNLLLWFTEPPTDGPRLRVTELSLLG